MLCWSEFAKEAPEIALAGRRRLVGPDGVAIAFLGTVSARGAPRLAPVCPIFCGDELYFSIGAHTPKADDLRMRHRYVLHAFLGQNDEEFQISGEGIEVRKGTERATVHRAIPFKAFKTSDPIFRLTIDRAVWVYWERVGEPDTKAIRNVWRAGGSAA
jgi:hypothetical protein